MPTKKPETSSSAPSPEQSGADFFDLPAITAADEAFLKSHPAPTFEQQIAHARWLLAWRRSRGIPDAHPPRQHERFEM
jgi:hypothetical protein